MPLFSVTYEIVTYESAEHGEAEESGFVCEGVGLREAVRELGGRAYEASSMPIGAGDCFVNHEFSECYRTGARESRCLHLPRNATLASTRRVARLLGVRVR